MSNQVSAISVTMPSAEAIRRLQSSVTKEGPAGAIVGEFGRRGYVGSFNGSAFRIRVARPMSQFYATYVFGRIDEQEVGSVIAFHFGHSSYANWALWVIRIVGALLVGGALIAAVQQPVFVFGAMFVALGVGLLLWAYRLRADDKERLLSLIVASTRAENV